MGKLFNRARMTVSGIPGTGNVTLNAAMSGFLSFVDAGVVDGDLVSYVIEDGPLWEIGEGTYTAVGTILTRTTVINSSNGGIAESFSSAAIVSIDALASDFSGYVPTTTLTDGATINWNVATAPVARLTLTASGHTLQTPTGQQDGRSYALFVSAGAYTLNFASSYMWPAGLAPYVAGETLLTFMSDGSSMWGIGQENFL